MTWVALTVVVSHVVGLGIYTAFSASTFSSAREQRVAEQLVTLTRLFEGMPRERRPEIARGISDYSLQLSIDPRPRVTRDDARGADARELRQLLGFAIGARLNEQILTDYREIAGDDLSVVTLHDVPDRAISARHVAELFRFRDDLLVCIRLEGGQWLNALAPGPAFAGLLSSAVMPPVVLMVVVAAVLSAWVIGRPLRALARFAGDVDAVGEHLPGQPPIREQGPPEVRRVIRAVNAMQRRIHGLLEDRVRLAGAVSSDLRAPLARMRLRTDYVDQPRERERMLRDIDDMDSMLASLAKGSGLEAIKRPRFRVDLRAMLEALTRELDLPAPAVELHGVSRLEYTCDPVAMREAFEQLLRNAVIYGGTARTRVELWPNEVAVLIDDDGSGLTETERERVFLPFYRLEPSRARHPGGIGVGLAIARTTLRAHGGDVGLKPASEGAGTRARVSLPWPDEEVVQLGAPGPLRPEPPGAGSS